MSKSDTTDPLAVFRTYAERAIRFYETGYDLKHATDPAGSMMVIGLVVEGGFGIGDDLFQAFRDLLEKTDAR